MGLGWVLNCFHTNGARILKPKLSSRGSIPCILYYSMCCNHTASCSKKPYKW